MSKRSVISADLVVVTQNIFGGGPQWPFRRSVLARRFAQLRPDVIALQEVHARWPTEGQSQADELAAAIGGYHVDFAAGRVEADGRCEGVALLCREDIREGAMTALSLDRRDVLDRSSQRVVLRTTLELDEGDVDLFVTHLSLSKRARHRTIREVMAFVDRQRGRSDSVAAVLMGDLNAEPEEEDSIGLLERGASDVRAGWCDAWTAAKGARARGATWPAIAPFRRIDYIFVQPTDRWRVRDADVEPVSGSDHRGVRAVLRMARARRDAA